MRYRELVEVYIELEKTTKRLEKTSILAKLLKKASSKELGYVMYLVQGRVFAAGDERKIGFSSKLMIKALSRISGESSSKIESLWKKIGDLGKIAEKLIKEKKQTSLAKKELDVEKVFTNIEKLASLTGAGTVERKISLVAELLSHADSDEARFITRTVLEDLRIGIAEGVIRDAIAEAYNLESKDVENAFDLLVDYREVAKIAKKGKKELENVELSVGKPIKVMLAILVKNFNEAFEYLGRPLQIEQKLDGFRLEVHKNKEGIKLFTRRLDEVTKQFPDVVEAVKKHVKGNSFILDSEGVGYDKKTGKYLPFQSISQRIKRKYDIEEMSKKFPVELNVFDIMYYNGEYIGKKPLKERRELLERIIKQKKREIVLTKKIVTDNEEEAKKFYDESLKAGNEGVMLKNLNAEYKAGRYVNYMCKLKPILEPLDLVIVGAEYGTGKRAGMLSSFVLACRHGNKFLECGMMGTGIKEKAGEEGITFKELTNVLKPYIIKEEGRKVKIKAEIVIEVGYEEIQKSPTYESGYALRFPKFLRLRNKEKKAADANSLKDVERIYGMQRGRNK